MPGTKAGKGVGIWLKLLLWAVVILAAFFYLRSINEKGSEGKPDEGIEQKAETVAAEGAVAGSGETVSTVRTAPKATSNIGLGSKKRPQSHVSRDERSVPESEKSIDAQSAAMGISAVGAEESPGMKPSQSSESTSPAAEAAERVEQAESSKEVVGEPSATLPRLPESAAVETDSVSQTARAESASTGDSFSAGPAPVALSLPKKPQAKREGAAAPGQQVRAQRSETRGVGGASVPPSLHAPTQSDAQKRRALSVPSVPTFVSPQSPEPGLSGPPGAAATSGESAATTDQASQSFEEQQACIMAEYRALRRERWELMREYREYTRAAARRSMRPYGYYPGYAPGYYRPWP